MLFCGWRDRDTRAAVYAPYDHLDLLLDWAIQRIGEGKIARHFAQTDDFFCKFGTACAPLCPYVGENRVYAERAALIQYECGFRVGVGRKAVERDYQRQPINVFDVGNVTEQIGKSSLKRLEIFAPQFAFGHASVHFQRPDGRYDDDGGRNEPCEAAFDIQKFFRAEIGAESRFGHSVVSKL